VEISIDYSTPSLARSTLLEMLSMFSESSDSSASLNETWPQTRPLEVCEMISQASSYSLNAFSSFLQIAAAWAAVFSDFGTAPIVMYPLGFGGVIFCNASYAKFSRLPAYSVKLIEARPSSNLGPEEKFII
jgi:hypothetical protein